MERELAPQLIAKVVDTCAVEDKSAGNSTDCLPHSVVWDGDIDTLVVAVAVPERTDNDILGDSAENTQEEEDMGQEAEDLYPVSLPGHF